MMGDYFFQNTYMAINKTKNSLICLLHSFIYTLCVMFICQWFDWRLLIVLATHFLMDRFRLAKYWRKFFSKDEDFPWVITADNSIHLLILWLLSLAK
jgi:hypothetical protein